MNEYQRLNITLPKKLLNKFRKFCEKEGMALSKRISILIEKELKGK